MRLLQIIGLLLLLTATVSAQNYTMLSFRAGGGVSSITFPSSSTSISGQQQTGIKTSSIYTYMAGIGLNIPLAGRLSFQPELTYIRKGYDLTYTTSGIRAQSKQTFNYVEVPLFLKVMFAKDRFRAFVFAGPSVGYALNGTYNATGTGGGVQLTQAGKIKFGEGTSSGTLNYYSPNDYSRLDLGFQGGLAVGTRLGTGLVMLEFRGGLGLTDFSKDEESKFRTGIVALSYGIPLGSVKN